MGIYRGYWLGNPISGSLLQNCCHIYCIYIYHLVNTCQYNYIHLITKWYIYICMCVIIIILHFCDYIYLQLERTFDHRKTQCGCAPSEKLKAMNGLQIPGKFQVISWKRTFLWKSFWERETVGFPHLRSFPPGYLSGCWFLIPSHSVSGC